jgi:hypothetical protein
MTRSRVLFVLIAGLVIAGLSAFGACLPTYTFASGGEPVIDGGGDATQAPDGTTTPDGSSGGGADATTDGAPGVDAPTDAPHVPHDAQSDAGPPGDAALIPALVTTAGAKAFATGFGYELHLVFAQNDGRYWFFYVDDTAGVIETATSPDLGTWTAGTPIALASGYSLADGNDFSVAYANLGGTDVVHIAANCVNAGNYAAFHLRATIAAGMLTAGAPVVLPHTDSNGDAGSSAGTCPQAGPATVVAADGHVFDVTAWTGHPSTTCDTNIYRSPAVDTGATWDPSPFTHDGYYVSVPSYAYSHDLVSLPEAGVVMAVWPDEDNQGLTLFDSFGWALSPSFAGGGPGTTGVNPDPTKELFNGTSATSSYNDWSVCRLADTDVHVVRHVTAPAGNSVSAFEEVVYNGATWQTTAPPPPAVTSLANDGVVLVGDGTAAHGMLLVTIGIDNALNIAKWTSGGTWAQVRTIAGSAPRQSLGGTGCGSPHPTVYWTEGASAPYAISRVELTSLLGP